MPAFVQGALLAILTTESLYSWFRTSIASPISIVLVCVEGLAGGYAYVSVFYQIGTAAPSAQELKVQDNEVTLLGVINYSVGCGRPGKPDVFASIPYYKDWIAETINKL